MKTLETFLSEHDIRLDKVTQNQDNPRVSLAGRHYRVSLTSGEKSYSLYVTDLRSSGPAPALVPIIEALILDCVSILSPISSAGIDGELLCEYNVFVEEAAKRREAYHKRLAGLKTFLGEEATKELLTRVRL